MYKKIDSFDSFEKDVEIFKYAIDCWSKIGNSRAYDDIETIDNYDEVSFQRIIINTISYDIGITFHSLEEKIKEDLEIEYKLTEKLKELHLNEYFIAKEPFSEGRYYREIRNALAHSNYELYYDDESKIYYIELENKSIKGKLPVSKFKEISKEIFLFDKYECGEEKEGLVFFEELINLDSTSQKKLNQAIEQLCLSEIKIPTPDAVYPFFEINVEGAGKGYNKRKDKELMEQFKLKELTSDEKAIYNRHLKYYGIKNYIKLNEPSKKRLLYMIARNELKGNVGYSISCESCLNMLKNRDKIAETDKSVAPIIYYKFVYSYFYYFLNHIFEEAKKDSNILSIFNNLELDNNLDISCYIKSEEPKKNKLDRKIKEAIERIREKKEQLEDIKNSRNNKDIEMLEKQIDEAYEILNELSNEYFKVNTKKVFEGLRNSVTHGTFNINYKKGLKKHNLNKSMMNFQDYNKKGSKTFDFSISIEDLFKVFDILIERIKHYHEWKNMQENTISEDDKTLGNSVKK